MSSSQLSGGFNGARVQEAPINGHEESGFELPAGPKDAVGIMEIVASVGNDYSADFDSRDLVDRYPAGNSSAAGAVANFVNTIVGAGIIGLPFAMAQSGLGAGIVMLFLAAMLTNQSTYMLIAAGLKTGRLNYEEMMGDQFGRWGIYVYCTFAGVLSFGAMAAYLIIVGDTIPTVVRASGSTTPAFTERSSVILMFGIFCVLPLSLLKDLSKLSYTSFASVMADLLLTFIVIFAGAKEARENSDLDGLPKLTFVRPTVFAGFGAISFAFVCQSSSFLVYRSMAKGGLNRWAAVTKWSGTIALLMGLTLALGGYLSFGRETQGNILNNFSEDHAAASVARAFLAITMVFTYPMEMYVTRHVIDFAVFQTMLGMGPPTAARHYGITMVLWVLTIILATSTDDLGDILEIFGAFGASAVGYIIPALLHMKAHSREMQTALAVWSKGSAVYANSFCGRLWAMRSFYVPISMVIFGVIAMVAGVATAIVSDLTQTRA